MDWQSRYHYQEATGSKRCGNCAAFKEGHCRMFDAPVEDDSVCDEWTNTWPEKKTSAQQVMYHVAPRSARESILANGLVPSDAEGQQERGVYLTRNPDFWRSFYRSPGSPHEGKDTEVWEVNMDGLPHHDDLTAEHGEDYYHPDVVAPNRLRLLSDERTAASEDDGWQEDGSWAGEVPPDEHVHEYGNRERWHPGDQAHFEYHCHRGHDSSDAQIWYRSHQPVTVLREEPSDGDWGNFNARGDAGTPRGYAVRWPDGLEHTAMEDELFVDPKHFDPKGGPPADAGQYIRPITGPLRDWPGYSGGTVAPDERTAGWEVVASPEEQAMLDANRGQDLAGLPGLVNVPNHGPLHFGSHRELQGLAADYMHQAGMPYNPPRTYVKVNPEHASRIAAEYDRAEHRPNDPKVAASYRAMIAETKAQYDHLVNNGYKFEFYPNHDPYPNSPREAVMDLHRNRHMYVFPTDEGFGTEHEETNHPLLADSGERWNGKPVTYNDLFRAVHDVYGHAKEGVGFRADGEDNAWRQHVAMFSPQARPAMTAETRGQNSWVNYGPHGEANRTADQASTVYADQKATVMPEWTYNEPEDAARTSRKREPSYVQRWIEQTHGPDEFHGHESDCLNPKCRHHWNEEEENELLNYGEIRCPECGLMQNMNGTIGPFNEEHSYHGHMPSGGTRGGLSFDDMGALGEQIVKRAALPGFTFKHDFSTQHKAWPVDHIWTDANGQDHGFEIKTNHSQAQPRFKLGDAKERNEKIKYCAENGLRQGLIGVRLNFHNNTADVFHRPQFTDTWVGAPTMTHMGTFDFSDLNPFKSPGEVPENLPEEHEDFPF